MKKPAAQGAHAAEPGAAHILDAQLAQGSPYPIVAVCAAQRGHGPEEAAAAYRPAVQSMHGVEEEERLGPSWSDFPAGQALQVAPSVSCPDGQALHEEASTAVLYLPAGHVEQWDPPINAPVLVIWPTPHDAQGVDESLSWS